MQFKVPQNITMEDKIIGPLTALQLGIVMIGGGLSFVVATSKTIPSPVNAGLGLSMALLTIVMAVGKFNGQPMYRFFKYFIAFMITPKVRVWHKTGQDIKLVKPSEHKKDEQQQHKVKNISRGDIAHIANVLDSRGKEGVMPSLGLRPNNQSKKS